MAIGELGLNLTVVIATRNRPEQSRQLVRGLESWECEVIVVDDFSRHPIQMSRVNVIRNSQRLGSSESWNIGARQAKNDWLLLIADDLIPESQLPEFIKGILPNLKPLDIIGFRIVGVNAVASRVVGFQNTLVSRIANILFGVDISQNSVSSFVPGAMIIQKNFFNALGGFNSLLFGGNGFREETDLQWRARMKGGRLIYIKNPFFHHLHVPGGHEKSTSLDDIYYMRNQTIFALRSTGLASLVTIPAFGAYLLANRMSVSTLARGVADGITTVLRNN
jgi:GT2 family glycosyltransferase